MRRESNRCNQCWRPSGFSQTLLLFLALAIAASGLPILTSAFVKKNQKSNHGVSVW